jgi:hypothetical protein
MLIGEGAGVVVTASELSDADMDGLSPLAEFLLTALMNFL